MSLQANNLVTKQHMFHPQQYSHCSCAYKCTLELLPFAIAKGTLQLVSALLITLRRPTTSQKHKQSLGNLAVATVLQSRQSRQSRPSRQNLSCVHPQT